MMELPEIVRRYLDAYNRRDVASMVGCVAEDVVFENVSNSGSSLRLEGREAFANLAGQAAEAFHDRRQTVTNAVVAGDMVALEIEWHGTPAVDLGPFKAGVEAAMRGASFMTIESGKLTRIADLS